MIGAEIYDPASAASANVAGSQILNTAQVQFIAGAALHSQGSNTVATLVDELINVSVVSLPPVASTFTAGATSQALAFRVTNTGNGTRSFNLSVKASQTSSGFSPVVKRIVVDADGDGQLNLAVDTVYQGAGAGPTLAPGQSVTVWVISDIPDGSTGAGQVSLTASAAVGTDARGTVLAGKGAGGGDAVMGDSSGWATAEASYVIGAPSAELIKSQTVVDENGGSRAMPGSTITYSLLARFTGSGAFTGARLKDAIPAGVTYVAGSVQLDGAPVSDAVAINSDGITVALGDVVGPAEHTLTFKVRINSWGNS